jgi:hypothetical protein
MATARLFNNGETVESGGLRGASVTNWLKRLRAGDAEIPDLIWQRYFVALKAVAKRQLSHRRRVPDDEEDIALSVLDTLIRRTANGRFPDLHDRHDLWCLLLAITQKKIAASARKENRLKRGGAEFDAALGYRDSVIRTSMPIEFLLDTSPTPDYWAAINDQNRHLMNLLRDEQLRQIARAVLGGDTGEEIAVRFDVSLRTIRRKIKLIRSTWAAALS